MNRILVFQDTEHIENTIDLLAVAEKMYAEEPFESYALVIAGSDSSDSTGGPSAANGPAGPLTGFFQKVIQLSHEIVEPHDQIGICEVLTELQKEYKFDAILVPATPFGRMIAPRLAKRLHTGIVADVTDIRQKDGRVEIIRPAYSGRIMAAIVTRGSGPVMMSVRPGVFKYSDGGGVDTEVSEYNRPVEAHSSLKPLEVKEKKISYDIRESDILISGGGGVLRNFAGLEHLAEALQGRVSASRKIVDRGIAPRSIQVGQSGRTVSPRLYIALGINGAIQHVEGMQNIESIIAVNTNRNAPICSLSDIVVEGDAMEFIDKLTDRIEAFRKGAQE
ncbi:MAG: electron transfer flavoprotein subunit alpha/FixB family protein [Spirochaetaceae bacterium]|nr:electron transfer flavoprotein subunit alpha/FixB family protein [Spirochaetaceae bacterium]MCF7948627.1 electron transfer flavoprotein subunit alpha/FixB family protein [Spirochaetia bacterium]MCF7951136.1 electron transfer flavoprotein subunit alpha/FixB family protein [Spirochaetaceae bacterium]